MEVFGGGSGGRKSVPRWEIEKMKKNMRKVPEIQKKSDEYHKKQAEEASKKLDEITKSLKDKEIKIIENNDDQKLTILDKIKIIIDKFIKK